jgi:hypothetical protein
MATKTNTKFWHSKTLRAKRYVYHNNSNVVYNIFLVPQQEEITQRKENDMYIRTTGDHVLVITKLFLLQPDECLVFCGGVSVGEMCREKGVHVCVTGASGDWFRNEKKNNPANGEYMTLT